MSGADARAHFHLDPDTQDKQTVSTITSTFQAIAHHREDGWDVKRR